MIKRWIIEYYNPYLERNETTRMDGDTWQDARREFHNAMAWIDMMQQFGRVTVLPIAGIRPC
jgi:hypothetical protein